MVPSSFFRLISVPIHTSLHQDCTIEVTARLFTAQGRAILGVVDGGKPQGVEDQAGVAWRKQFLRQIGYKLA
jgi:adenosine/AMP kinase